MPAHAEPVGAAALDDSAVHAGGTGHVLDDPGNAHVGQQGQHAGDGKQGAQPGAGMVQGGQWGRIHAALWAVKVSATELMQ